MPVDRLETIVFKKCSVQREIDKSFVLTQFKIISASMGTSEQMQRNCPVRAK